MEKFAFNHKINIKIWFFNQKNHLFNPLIDKITLKYTS